MPMLRQLILFSLSCTYPIISYGSEHSPNVLFIAIDDLNSCLEGMEGETTVPTPHMNRLASRGVLFTNAHCAAPGCNPSRASVMTGIAPSTSGVYLNDNDWRANRVLKDRITLPQHFKNHGYKTLGAGKLYHAASLSAGMHEGYLDPRPWDDYFPSKSQQLPDEVEPAKIPMNGSPKQYRGYMDWASLDIDADEMADAKVVSWAEEHLARSHDQPLFLAVGIYRPHIPWWTPKTYFDRHPIEKVVLPEVIEDDLADVPEIGRNMRKQGWHQWIEENGKWEEAVQAYNASVSFTDDMIGRLLTALESGPMADNTVVVLWSDHGYHLGQKAHWEKFALWEQTTRVPLILAAPGLTGGRRCNEPVSLLDVFPTLGELCGLPEVADLDGVSLAPLLKRPKRRTGRTVVITQGFQNHAVRSDKWRYIRYADGTEELYDQIEDPKNFYNLASVSRHQQTKRKLALSLPSVNAEPHPTFKGQAAMNEKYKTVQEK